MTASGIPGLLEPIQARLDAAWCEVGETCPAQSCKRNRETARLLAAVKAVERVAKNLDELADGDRHYANLFRSAVESALRNADV